MKIFKIALNVNVIFIVLLLIIVAIMFSAYLYVEVAQNEKFLSVLSGIISGLVIAIVQLCLSYYEYREISILKAMKIFSVRADRDKRDFYEQMIRDAKERIDVMGVTAERFMEHFADIDGHREESKVLLTAMSRGVKIRIFVPSKNHLSNENNKINAEQVKMKFEKVKTAYPNNFAFKYFDHPPSQSIFLVDTKCIVGPVFPKLPSKDTPSIYLSTESPFAKRYLEYFEDEWTSY